MREEEGGGGKEECGTIKCLRFTIPQVHNSTIEETELRFLLH